MRALCWNAKNDIRCETVPDPSIEDGRDVILRVTSCAICGSDLHLMDGQMPTMEQGDVLGHEFMGEVVEVGAPDHVLKKGDRVVVPFNINCGQCRMCKMGNWASCLVSNRNGAMAAKQFGYPTAGLFGYSHLTGGYAGGQAEYVRVPMADVGPMKVPEGMTDEQALFLSDILPTGWQAMAYCDLKGGESVAIWGAGPGRAVRDQVGRGDEGRADHLDRDGARAHRAGPDRRRHRRHRPLERGRDGAPEGDHRRPGSRLRWWIASAWRPADTTACSARSAGCRRS